MWNVKARVIPVITGATGTIANSLRRYRSSKPGQHEIKELQKKNNHFGNCTHTVESANVKVQNIFNGRNNITSRTNCKHRISATTIYPKNMGYFRCIIVNTLHKGEKRINAQYVYINNILYIIITYTCLCIHIIFRECVHWNM